MAIGLHKILSRGSVALLAAWAALSAPLPASATEQVAPSKTLELIRKRGSVQIGIKTDFPPFGQLREDGLPQGLEVDLGHDIARQLEVPAVFVNVTQEDRLQKLDQGAIDILIASVADTEARRDIATAIEPHYYSSGVTVLLGPGQRVTDWTALRGQTVCVAQGAYFNRPASQRYLLELLTFRTSLDALLALREGSCVGYLNSSASMQTYLEDPDWAGYTTLQPEILKAPWAIQIAKDEDGSELERVLGDISAQWHRSGFLIEREKAWGIKPTQFLVDEQARWSRRDPQGGYACARDSQGQWPASCRSRAFVRAEQASGLLGLGLWIRDKTGLDLIFIYDDYDRGIFLRGLMYTLLMMASTVVLSLAIGLVATLAVEKRKPFLGPLVRGLAVYGETTPPPLMMYLVFFGVGSLVSTHLGWQLAPVPVAIGCLSYFIGAQIMTLLLDAADAVREDAPAFRARLQDIPKLMDLSAGPLKSVLTLALKLSVMGSAIAVPEILSATRSIIADHGNVTLMMNVFILLLFVIVGIWRKIFDLLGKVVQRHVRVVP